jgi:hypothetical protein
VELLLKTILKVSVRSGNQPNIDSARHVFTDAFELSLLKYPQQHLPQA